jgi:CDP-diacylglycerol--glycerol-3-phosphate 3-phosphatidyltransferase
MVAFMLFFLSQTFPFSKSLALLLFLIAGITDFLDGYLARNVYGVSSFGQLMDPLADKIMICAIFVALTEIRLPYVHSSLVPAWIVVIIISREFLVTGLRLLAANRGKVISAGKWGKHKTVWQIVAAVVLLMGLAIRYDIYLHADVEFLQKYDLCFDYIAFAVGIGVAMITVASGAIYFNQHLELISRHMEH